jgi:beta-aspartyl-peptidase (threonine type)
MSGAAMILVHGGAGDMDPAREGDAIAGCEKAARVGDAVLRQGGAALDAVVAAVRVLEELPHYNAGVGAVLSREGTVEVDAAVMRGSDLAVGAIAAVPNAANGVELARAVLEDGEHALLSGEAAWRFLRESGFYPATADELITERSRRRLEAERARRAMGSLGEPDPGTVGAVARDNSGSVAAATSTGGTTFKRAGRIGDTPLFGCGTYADDRGGAASATGHGESIIRVAMAHVASVAMARGDAQAAAEAAVAALDRVKGRAGIICVDPAGRIGIAHNTRSMPVAWMGTADDEPGSQARAKR